MAEREDNKAAVTPRLFRLLYRSALRMEGSEDAVNAAVDRLVARAVTSNAGAGVTGALVLVDRVFVQAIEGERQAVEAVFERICRDLRHTAIELLDFVEVEERAFGPWSMVRINHRELDPAAEEGLRAALRLTERAGPADVVREMRAALHGLAPPLASPSAPTASAGRA